jgi:hypothetical protein
VAAALSARGCQVSTEDTPRRNFHRARRRRRDQAG